MACFADPAIKLQVAIVLQWHQLAQSQADQLPGLASMWRSTVKAVLQKNNAKWHFVKSPMAATIATLLDAGWSPGVWNQWIGTHGCSWLLADDASTIINLRTCDGMLRALRRDLLEKLWQQSSINTMLSDKIPWMLGLRKRG